MIAPCRVLALLSLGAVFLSAATWPEVGDRFVGSDANPTWGSGIVRFAPTTGHRSPMLSTTSFVDDCVLIFDPSRPQLQFALQSKHWCLALTLPELQVLQRPVVENRTNLVTFKITIEDLGEARAGDGRLHCSAMLRVTLDQATVRFPAQVELWSLYGVPRCLPKPEKQKGPPVDVDDRLTDDDLLAGDDLLGADALAEDALSTDSTEGLTLLDTEESKPKPYLYGMALHCHGTVAAADLGISGEEPIRVDVYATMRRPGKR